MTHELRRPDRAITDDAEIDAILAGAKYATIALADGEQPYAVTLSCGYDAQRARLCFHVARAGRKLDIIARNPRACATVVAEDGYGTGRCEHPFRSVVLFGRMRVLTDAEDAREAMRTLIGQLESEADGAAIWERNKLDAPRGFDSFRMVVLDIEERSAKRGK